MITTQEQTPLVTELSGRVHPRLTERLRDASLFGAVSEIGSPRFLKYVMQPKQILRNGWLLDPDLALEQSEVRAYVLRAAGVTQRLVLDRQNRQALVHTFTAELSQEIRVDMESLQVVENRVTAPVSLN